MYVRSFKSKDDEGKSKIAVYLETIETGTGANRELATVYFSGNKAKCEIDTICAELANVIFPESQKITIFTENHAVAWDFLCIKNGESPEFIQSTYWNKLLKAMSHYSIPLGHIEVKEGGLLKQAVTIRANEYISNLAKSDKNYASFT